VEKKQKTRFLWLFAGRLLVLALAVLCGAGCTAMPQSERPLQPPNAIPSPAPALTELNNALAAAALQAPTSTANYRLGPEDLLHITLFNVPEAEAGVTPRNIEARVSQQGAVTLPLLGDIPAAG